jgi:hypothetical protein
MSNVKFSQLPNLGNITANTIVPVVSVGTNYTVTAANLQSYVNSSTGNVTAGNIRTGGLISATGNVTSGNVSIVGGTLAFANSSIVQSNPLDLSITGVYQISVKPAGGSYQWTFGNDGALTGPTGLGVTGYVSATGNVQAGNVRTAGLVSATANITGGNVLTGGLISAAGTVTGTSHLGSVVSVTGNVTGGNILTAGVVTATGNIVTAGNFVGNGAALTNVTVSVAGNIVGTQSNVSLVAGSYTTTFDNTGNTAFANGTVSVTRLTASGNITGGNILTGGVISSTGNITGGNISATNHTGTTMSVTGNITAANFFGNGNTLSNVATRFEGAWTAPVGNSTQSFTVAASETYYMWVDCNIPNGILAWNATATITNTNVPVVGVQYAWVYNGGGTPIDFTSIPNQFVGTANSIVRSSTAPSATTNRFDFGINNTSGASQTVRYGWIAIS